MAVAVIVVMMVVGVLKIVDRDCGMMVDAMAMKRILIA